MPIGSSNRITEPSRYYIILTVYTSLIEQSTNYFLLYIKQDNKICKNISSILLKVYKKNAIYVITIIFITIVFFKYRIMFWIKNKYPVLVLCIYV